MPWMCGNMKSEGVGGCWVGLGCDVPETLERVVLEGKLGVSGFVAEVEVEIGVSEARSR